MRKKIVSSLILLLVSANFVSCGNKKVEEKSKEADKEINISVAASLVKPITEIAEIYEKENGVKVNINSGGSGTLKKQISEGADIGLFFSADEKYIDELIEEGIVLKENKINPVSNILVLIKNNDSKENINEISDLNKINAKIALGEVSTVPAGEYAKESLINMGIFTDIESNIIYCKDVTAVKTYVERGEVDYGFVYKSDAMDLNKSSIVKEVPDNLHKKINYSLAPIESYKEIDECKKLIDLIVSNEGKAILEKYGFKVEV